MAMAAARRVAAHQGIYKFHRSFVTRSSRSTRQEVTTHRATLEGGDVNVLGHGRS